ncbi:unnamed protein product [Brassicogethes aeneus]|uniref:Uncharacterized protein n=1 Tax=Brassicogethes aeneus TaxID=1431903 RepID=A0A9P0B2Y3_BRAAE|nr:unnamed protein product [Brassicogethes aeneus]
MVKWSTITIATAIIYLVPVKYIITAFIDYYKNRPIKMKNRTAIVVLDKIGLNYEKAREYAKQNCKIILASKNVKKAETAKKEIIQISKNKKITVIELDCTKKDVLKNFAENISKTENSIDVIVNNDGFEMTEMDIIFRDQKLAKERLETHFCTFLLEE